MVGRFVLQRINAAYRDQSVQMTYSNVLAFSSFYKMPVSKSPRIQSANKYYNFAETLFSQFLWSFRSKHASEVEHYLDSVEKVCGKEDVGLAAFGLKMFEKEQIRRIDEFDVFVENDKMNENKICL